MRQLYRDWSAEGAVERQACHDLVLRDLETEFSPLLDKNATKVLVPGAGLGRLVLEICLRGFAVEGNEISFHQMIASNWILNHTIQGETYDFHPFVTDYSNVVSRDDQLRVVKVPDIHPGTLLEEASRSVRVPCAQRLDMVAGDFITAYNNESSKGDFDAVVTMFFIDTAPNLIRYIETVRNCLKSGGVWINLGPLLWHWEDRAPTRNGQERTVRDSQRESSGIEAPGSFELTNEEVLLLVGQMGFNVEKQEIRNDGVGYIHNAESMLHNTYRNAHWVARKQYCTDREDIRTPA